MIMAQYPLVKYIFVKFWRGSDVNYGHCESNSVIFLRDLSERTVKSFQIDVCNLIMCFTLENFRKSYTRS